MGGWPHGSPCPQLSGCSRHRDGGQMSQGPIFPLPVCSNLPLPSQTRQGPHQPPILDIFFPGCRQAPTLSVLSGWVDLLRTFSHGRTLPQSSPTSSISAQPRAHGVSSPGRHRTPHSSKQHPPPTTPPGHPTTSSAGHTSCSELPSSHSHQFRPLKLPKAVAQLLGTQRGPQEPSHQGGIEDSPPSPCPLFPPPQQHARHRLGCSLLFFQLPAEVSWKGLRAALNTFFWRKK